MRRGRPAVALAVMAVALGALHLVLVLPVHGFLLSDTTGYLANARWLAGEAGHTWQGPSSFYHPLWSLLVAPIYLALDLPRHVQIGALVLNGLLAVAVLPAAYALGRRAFHLAEAPALAAAGVAAAYPAVLLLAGYEWAEPLYQLLFVAFVLAVAAMPSTRAAIAVGVLGGALNATHPRGLGVVVVAGVYLVLVARRDRRALIGLAALVVVFVLTRLADSALLHAIYGERSAGVEGDVFGRLTDPHLVVGAVKATIGQLWYLTVASFGLVPLGALWLVLSRKVDRTVAVVTLAAGLAMLAASALEMADGTRVDHMVYGRYLEGAVPVFLVAGVAAVVAWRGALPRLLVLTTGAGAVLAAVLVLVRGGDAFNGNAMPLNITGILVWHESISDVDVLRATAAALVVTAAAWLCARWRPVVGVGLVGLVFAVSAVSVQARTLDSFDDTFSGMTRISETLRTLPRGSVGYDRAAYDHEAANLYQLELSDRNLRFVDSRKARPDTTYVIGGARWRRGQTEWGARLVYVEKGLYEQGLWVLPGTQQDRLVGAGRVLLDRPLPPEALEQRITVDPPSNVTAGTTKTVTVHVTHVGRGAGWVPFGAIPQVTASTIRLGGRWFDAGGEQQAGQLAELDHAVLPGQSDDIRLPLTAPTKPGRYVLRIGLLEEGVTWFPGDATFTVVVR